MILISAGPAYTCECVEGVAGLADRVASSEPEELALTAFMSLNDVLLMQIDGVDEG